MQLTCSNLLAITNSTLPYAERSALIQEAITEAKEYSIKKELGRKAQAQTNSAGRRTNPTTYYKQMTKEARRQGEARELLEGMIRRAERKLAEQQKKSHTAQVQSAEARAEELATELFHRPGSLLTEDEVDIMVVESGCRQREDFEELIDCYTPTFGLYRRIDGTCNNLDNPFLGAADTALVRLIPAQYEDGISSLRGDIQNKEGSIFDTTAFQPPNPSARHVSQSVIRDVANDETFTHILMQWGQFLDHDLSLSPELEDECPTRALNCEFTDVCRPIRVTDVDPVFGIGTSNNGACIAFSRSLAVCADPTLPIVTGFPPREQINVLTSFIDGSMIYGSDEELARKIRLFEGGLLIEGDAQPGKKPELPRIFPAENVREDGERFVGCPPSTLGCFLAGEFRVNEQVVLSVMHTLWFREHNRIVRELAKLNPTWTDERLYQEARKIVGAIIQEITYYDYLPIIFGKKVFDIVVGDYTGYDPRINPGVTNAFSTAAYRYGHTLIRPLFDRLGSGYTPIASGPLDLFDIFLNPDQFRASFGTDPLVRGLVSQNARRVDEFLSSALTNSLFREQLDLASLNIQRGRDHGLPPYLTWQRYCQRVFPMLNMTDFTNTLTLVRFLEVYGSLDTVDLWIGGLAEDRLPGSLLGPTFACLFGITFANIRDGDRFFYKAEGVFEPSQVASIEQHTLSRVICDNSDNIDEIQTDAFRSDLPRVPCTDIPGIDLTLWQEEMCYYRLNSAPRSVSLGLRSYSRSMSPTFSLFAGLIPANAIGTTSTCVPVTCPHPGSLTEVIIYIEELIPLGDTLQLQSNPLLPPNLFTVPLAYRAAWPESIFDSAGTGVHRSLAACEAVTSTPALEVVSFASSQQLDLDLKILDALEQQNKSEDDAASPETDERIPEEIRPYLLTDFGDMGWTQQEEKQEETKVQDTVVSDAQLMSDLEDALKSLNT